jgi:hypothetical protein
VDFILEGIGIYRVTIIPVKANQIRDMIAYQLNQALLSIKVGGFGKSGDKKAI